MTEQGHATNELGQPIGLPVNVPRPIAPPQLTTMRGRFCEVASLNVGMHGIALYEAYAAAADDGDWTYLGYGPFDDEASFLLWLRSVGNQADPLFFAIVDAETKGAAGLAAYLRIDPAAGCIEVGHIHLARCLQRTPAATEAMYLMMKRVFESGYRRFEWKCDDLNAPSRSAATRLGFSYEGTFRQALHYKGRNRDTAWYSIIDTEWPALDTEFARWLDSDNFDEARQQQSSLAQRST